jgi:hypothetical protein
MPVMRSEEPAHSPGELAYAFDYTAANRDIIVVREA